MVFDFAALPGNMFVFSIIKTDLNLLMSVLSVFELIEFLLFMGINKHAHEHMQSDWVISL